MKIESKISLLDIELACTDFSYLKDNSSEQEYKCIWLARNNIRKIIKNLEGNTHLNHLSVSVIKQKFDYAVCIVSSASRFITMQSYP